jgi:hypothetical protein
MARVRRSRSNDSLCVSPDGSWRLGGGCRGVCISLCNCVRVRMEQDSYVYHCTPLSDESTFKTGNTKTTWSVPSSILFKGTGF